MELSSRLPMPDRDKTDTGRHTKVEVESNSGAFRVLPPTASAKTPTDTKLEITPGTSVHEVLVSDVPHEATPPDEGEAPRERRRQQTPVNVQVQQPVANGLAGTWGQIAQFTAVGALIVFAFYQLRDFSASVREERAIAREDQRQLRSELQASQAAVAGAITSLATKVDTLGGKLDAVAAANNAAAASNNAAVAANTATHAEVRSAVQEMRAIAKVLMKTPEPTPEPEPGRGQGVTAPMPRVAGGTAGG